MQLQKGQQITVINNSIFEMMGYSVVTGRVFTVNPNGKSVSIQCNETGAIELVDLTDGTIELN